MRGLSTFFTENTIDTRRSLRSNIEKRSLTVNEEFLTSFGQVKQKLDILNGDVMKMSATVNSMIIQVRECKDTNKDMLDTARKLKEDTDLIEMRHTIDKIFIDSFKLTADEMSRLSSSSTRHDQEAISDKFFSALKEIELIHGKAKQLLHKGNKQTTIIQLMDSMALYQEAAFERLYRWTLNGLRSYNADSVSDSLLVQRSLSYLQAKPALLQNCLDEYITVRRAAIVRSFIDALTRGTSSGSPAIDRYATEPVRYVGDILGYLHQALVAEKDQLRTLLRNCETKELEARRTIIVGLSSITEGLARPAKTRIEQQLVSDSKGHAAGPLNLYKIKNLLLFYKNTIAVQVIAQSELIYGLDELCTLSQRMFLNSINYTVASKLGKTMSGDQDMAPDDLSPMSSFNEMVAIIGALFKAYLESPVRDEANEDVNEILSVTLNPLIKAARISGTRLGTVELAIYQINCLNELVATVSIIGQATGDLVDGLKRQVDEQVDTLVKEQLNHVLTFLSMASLWSALRTSQSLSPLSSTVGCDSLAIQTCSKNLDTYLASPLNYNLPQLELLASSDLKDQVRGNSIEQFCQVYDKIYRAINDPVNYYDQQVIDFLHHSPDNVRSLLT